MRIFISAFMVACSALGLDAAVSAPAPALALTPGACVMSGSASFTPALTVLPADFTVNISLAGSSCATLAGTNTASLTLSGGFLMSCAGGVGSVAGQVIFGTTPPSGGAVTAIDVTTPGVVVLAVSGAGFTGVAALAAAGCPVNPATASLTGSLAFSAA